MSGRLPRRVLVAGGAAAAALPVLMRARAAVAQAWPTQPIKLVVPFAPAGSTDLVARILAQGLQERLGQPVVVENRPGAGAMIGSQAVAQAAPDGYTLVLSNIASHGISPLVYPGNRYDAVRDFTHIALIITNPAVFVANKGFAPQTLPQVVAESRRNPAGIDIASSGIGSSNHLLIVEFTKLTGGNINHVPYRGAGPAMTDVIAGVVPMLSDSLPSAAAHIRQGSVRALAMPSEQRHPAFPEVPTFREQGIDLLSGSWFGLSGPANLPAPVVDRVAGAVREVLAVPAVRQRFTELGGSIGTLSPAGYAEFIAAELAHYAPVVRTAGVRVE